MAAKKLSIGEKKKVRDSAKAAAPAAAGKTPIDRLVSSINQRLGGKGTVSTASSIEHRSYERRSTGIPSLDYVLSGGYAKGGLHMYGGEYSTGKTSVALEGCIYAQRHEAHVGPAFGAVGWVALEPFSKRHARERGLWLPFSEDPIVDKATGLSVPRDPFAEASALELLRMEQQGITDPYKETTKFILVQEERGDVALDVALDMVRSNLFAFVVVDSLGVAKSTKWLEENEVQDAGDFPREAKMIGDYTSRLVLGLNKRYDENNVVANDGVHHNQTTVIHLNHIVTNVGTQARAKHKTQSIKGGEGNKHNHHVIVFLWKGELYQAERPGAAPYRYAQETRCMALKSKLGPPMKEGSFDLYMQPYGPFQTGDFDVVKDLVGLAVQAGVITRAGAWYRFGDEENFLNENGKEAFATVIRNNPDWYEHLASETQKALRS